MKIYMSYWSGDFDTFNFKNENGKYLIDLHKLSLYYINKNYGECHLITDSKTKKYLQHLPFKSISTELDCLKNIKSKNWALGKLYAYKIIAEKKEHFMHVDYDVFLTKKLPEEITNSELFVQETERFVYTQYGLFIFDQFVKNRYDIGKINKNDEAYNVGVIGGTNTDFIFKYASNAIQFTLDKNNFELFNLLNKACLAAIGENVTDSKRVGPSPAVVCEQYYLWHMCKKYNIPTKLLFNIDPFGYTKEEYGHKRNELSKELGYVHLCSKKKHHNVMKTVRENVKKIDEGILL